MKLKLTPELSRIHAHICGDGCVYLKKEKRSKRKLEKRFWSNPIENVWVIEYTNTSQELLDEFNDDLKLAFNRKGQIRTKYHKIRLTSVKWILDLLQLRNKNSYNWCIPNFIMKSDLIIAKAWLRAFFDDEATVTQNGIVRVKSMNMGGLSQVKELIFRFGIEASLTGPNCDRSYYLHIFKKFSKDYVEKIGFNHIAKRKRIISIIKKNEPGGI